MSKQLQINKCAECPHREVGHRYSGEESWEWGEDWHCKKADKVIFKFVVWNDRRLHWPIPNWCPLDDVNAKQ